MFHSSRFPFGWQLCMTWLYIEWRMRSGMRKRHNQCRHVITNLHNRFKVHDKYYSFCLIMLNTG